MSVRGVGAASLSLSLLLLLLRTPGTEAHGRLIEPPSRASMWRYGFKTPPDYNDHESYCGGFTRQWVHNGGQCGICGDPWDSPEPRAHEGGGKYGQGIVVRRYKKGAAFTIRVEITANHRGYFEFRLCKQNSPMTVATQRCLDQHVLRRAKTAMATPSENYHPTRYYVGTENKVYEIRYRLPDDLTCSQCVLQWRYLAGNNWGKCDNGSAAIGCGPQEEFRACADIAIEDKNGDTDETPYIDTGHKDQDNEVNLDSNEVDSVSGQQQEQWYFMSLLIIMSALFLTILFYTALFIYYYGANKTMKPCWQLTFNRMRKTLKPKSGAKIPPMPPPRMKKSPNAQISVVSIA